MKTLYFETNQYVRRQGNVIDLNEYRERMQRAAAPKNAVGDDVTYQWQTDESVWHYEERRSIPSRKKAHPAAKAKATGAKRLAPAAVSRRRAERTERSLADWIELCAAAATLGLVITVWLQFLLYLFQSPAGGSKAPAGFFILNEGRAKFSSKKQNSGRIARCARANNCDTHF